MQDCQIIRIRAPGFPPIITTVGGQGEVGDCKKIGQEAAEDGAGRGIFMVVGSGRNRKNLVHNIA